MNEFAQVSRQRVTAAEIPVPRIVQEGRPAARPVEGQVQEQAAPDARGAGGVLGLLGKSAGKDVYGILPRFIDVTEFCLDQGPPHMNDVGGG